MNRKFEFADVFKIINLNNRWFESILDANKKVHDYIDDIITEIMQITNEGINVDYLRYLEKEKIRYQPENEC